MSDDTPFAFVWDGEAMRPRPGRYWPALAAERFIKGEQYWMTEQRERSARSHAHYFASLADAFSNLPESVSAQFPTPDHLRKYALIKTGYYDKQTWVFDTERKAQEVAVALGRIRNEFAIVSVMGCAVVRLTAKSQRERVMGAKEFQESKQAVINYVAMLIGVDADTLKAEAGQSA